MKKLTESNKLLLKALCLEMGIKGEIDDLGNVHDVVMESTKEPVEKTIFGLKFNINKRTKVEKSIPKMTLQEVVSLRLQLDYDPNVIVRSMMVGALEEKE